MRHLTRLLLLTLATLLPALKTGAQQPTPLEQEIISIVKDKRATVGVSVVGLNFAHRLSVNGDRRVPMQSVYKLHIALAVLHRVDGGKLSLNQMVQLTPKLYSPNLWSPLRDRFPQGVTLPLSEIIAYTVAWSDNSGSDLLLEMLGGPPAAESYIKGLGIDSIAITSYERQIQSSWELQFKNWTTPNAATQLLAALYHQQLLSEPCHAFIWRVLTETTTGAKRLRGGLPPGTLLAHKTGTSGTNGQGITAATNDIGVVAMPNGRAYAIAVFVTNSRENEAANEAIIAQISGAVYKAMLHPQK